MIDDDQTNWQLDVLELPEDPNQALNKLEQLFERAEKTRWDNREPPVSSHVLIFAISLSVALGDKVSSKSLRKQLLETLLRLTSYQSPSAGRQGDERGIQLAAVKALAQRSRGSERVLMAVCAAGKRHTIGFDSEFVAPLAELLSKFITRFSKSTPEDLARIIFDLANAEEPPKCSEYELALFHLLNSLFGLRSEILGNPGRATRLEAGEILSQVRHRSFLQRLLLALTSSERLPRWFWPQQEALILALRKLGAREFDLGLRIGLIRKQAREFSNESGTPYRDYSEALAG